MKAEPFDITNHTRLEPLDLSVGRRFDTWVVAENTIKEFGKRNGFVINRHRVEYSKNQLPDSDEKLVKKRTYVCECFGKYHLSSSAIKDQRKLTANGILT